MSRTLRGVSCFAWLMWAAFAVAQEPAPPPPAAEVSAACNDTSGCPSGQSCEAGACVASCVKDSDCHPDFRCQGFKELEDGQWTRGVCQSARAGGRCSGRGQCAHGFICAAVEGQSDGVCEDKRLFKRARHHELVSVASEGEATRLRYRGGPIPAGYHLVSPPSLPALIGGLGAFAAGWGAMIASGLLLRRPEFAIPFVGPFLPFPELRWSGWDGLASGFAVFGLVLDAAVQIVGAAAFATSFFVGPKYLEPDEPTVTLVPASAGAPVGASLVGRF